jgi:uncharacterized protein
MLRDDSGNGGGRPSAPLNVLGDRLDVCSMTPETGFLRDGCCNTGPEDVGSHTVCAVMTAAFLEFSKSRGNDLSTPMLQFGFPGLRPGDRWCLCAPRWREALEAGYAPGWSCGLLTKVPSTTARSPISSDSPWISPDFNHRTRAADQRLRSQASCGVSGPNRRPLRTDTEARQTSEMRQKTVGV